MSRKEINWGKKKMALLVILSQKYLAKKACHFDYRSC